MKVAALLLLALLGVAQAEFLIDLSYTGYVGKYDDAEDLFERFEEVTDPSEDEFVLWNGRYTVQDSVQEIDDGVWKVEELDPVNTDVTMYINYFGFQKEGNCVTFGCTYQLQHTFHSQISLCLEYKDDSDVFTTKWIESPCKEPEDESYGPETIEACQTVSTLYAEYGLALLTTYVEGFKLDAAVTTAKRVEDRLIQYGIGN